MDRPEIGQNIKIKSAFNTPFKKEHKTPLERLSYMLDRGLDEDWPELTLFLQEQVQDSRTSFELEEINVYRKP